jgi:hypothetical protein
MPRKKPADIILERMTDDERHEIVELEGNRENARWQLKRCRDRIRARIMLEVAKEQAANP